MDHGRVTMRLIFTSSTPGPRVGLEPGLDMDVWPTGTRTVSILYSHDN
jgi:hypothetical protein